MGEVLLGAAALVLVLMLVRGFLKAPPSALAKALRIAGAIALGVVAAGLFATERIGGAVFVASMAWGLFTGGRVWPGGWPHYGAPHDAGAPSGTKMTRTEALKVLGLEEGATEEEIRAAHRRLILQNHPDKGGSDYLASKINEAKDVLLGS
jgi:DnaJ family protein C protein 19